MEFMTNDKYVFHNLTSPDPGYYYVAVFIAYTDPKFNAITQQGKFDIFFCKTYFHSSFVLFFLFRIGMASAYDFKTALITFTFHFKGFSFIHKLKYFVLQSRMVLENSDCCQYN